MGFALGLLGVVEVRGLVRVGREEVEELLVVRDADLVLVDPELRQVDLLAVLIDELASRDLDHAGGHSALGAAEKAVDGEDGHRDQQEGEAGGDEELLFLPLFRLLEKLLRLVCAGGEASGVLGCRDGFCGRGQGACCEPVGGVFRKEARAGDGGWAARFGELLQAGDHGADLVALVVGGGLGGQGDIVEARPHRTVEQDVGGPDGTAGQIVLLEILRDLRGRAQRSHEDAIVELVAGRRVGLERVTGHEVRAVVMVPVRRTGFMHGEQIRVCRRGLGPRVRHESGDGGGVTRAL